MQEPLANVAVLAAGNGSPHVSVAQFLIGGRFVFVNMLDPSGVQWRMPPFVPTSNHMKAGRAREIFVRRDNRVCRSLACSGSVQKPQRDTSRKKGSVTRFTVYSGSGTAPFNQ